MTESLQLHSFTPEGRWYDQADIPLEFRELTHEQQGQYIRGLSAWAINGTIDAQGEQSVDRPPFLEFLGEKALAGATQLTYSASQGTEDIFLRVIGARR